MVTSDEELLRLHGITKQVKIKLFRTNVDTVSISGLLSQNPDKKQKSKPRTRNLCQKENPYRCHHPNCNYQNKHYCKVTEHMIKKHSEEKPFKCKECGKGFKSTDYLKAHLKIHLPSEEKKFVCSEPDCKFKSALKFSLKKHMLTHSTNKPFKCQVCNGFFKTAATLKGHLVTHSDVRKYVCSFPSCSSTFRQSFALDKHLRLHTSNEKPHKCSICGWRSRYKHCVQKHMANHGAEKKKYTCEKCDYVASAWYDLKVHRQAMHPDSDSSKQVNKRFKCSQCEFAAKYPSELKVHSRKHLEVKPLSCFVCEYKTITQHFLNNHMRRHTGEKPYTCSECDFRASSHAGVFHHFNALHNKTRLRKHKCELCPKAFFIKTDLNIHMRSHTRQKPRSAKKALEKM